MIGTHPFPSPRRLQSEIKRHIIALDVLRLFDSARNRIWSLRKQSLPAHVVLQAFHLAKPGQFRLVSQWLLKCPLVRTCAEIRCFNYWQDLELLLGSSAWIWAVKQTESVIAGSKRSSHLLNPRCVTNRDKSKPEMWSSTTECLVSKAFFQISINFYFEIR